MAGRNPQTGTPITIEARRVVKFISDAQFFESMGAKTVVGVRGLGLFEVKVYGAYQGRNPNTGEIIEVAEKRGALFRSAPELRERLETAPVPAAPSDEGEFED